MKSVKKILAEQNIEIEDAALETMERYMEEVLAKNENVNLTAITDRDEFIQKHFIDSLLCAGCEEMTEAARIVDIGTGAGFPGVPLAIVFPEKEFVLVDSLNKRVKIITELCRELGIDNVKAVHGRAEELARREDLRESFDICVSRAVAGMRTLAKYCLPFVKCGGTFIAYKGPDCSAELEEAANAIETTGGGEVHLTSPIITGVPFEHTLVFVRKEWPTPKAYPRKSGTPAKKPL